MKSNYIKRTVMLFVISAMLIYPQNIMVHASKAAVTEEGHEEDVETFIGNFYKAHTKETIESMQEKLDGSRSRNYIARCKVLFASGFNKYDNIAIKVYALQEKNAYLATVAYDAFFEGIDVGLPGADTVMVKETEDNRLVILQEDVSSDLSEEVLRIVTSDEVVELMNEMNAKLNDILADNPEIWEWITKLSGELTEQTSSYLENSEDTQGNIAYIVKEGDCLWSIAQNELGNGMYWSRVYEANKGIIGENPDLILVGMQLQL